MSISTESSATKLIARVKHSADEEWTMGGSVASSAGTLHTEKTLASYVKVTDGVRKVQLKSSFTQSGFRPQVFSFSRCFSQETTQAAFFAECGAIHSIDCLLGTCGNLETPSTEIGNFCMIAYGQTGSGKSHTMFGSCPSTGQPLNHSHIDAAVEENYETETLKEDPHSQPGDGLIVRSIEYLLMQLLHSVAAVPTFHLKLSCFEIYEDLVYDLFSGSNTLPVHVHEDAIEGFSVQGCQLIDCTSFESAAAAIELIARHRRGRYAPNSRTSPLKDKDIHHSVHKVDRSHCIIEISVCVPMMVGEGGMSVYNSGLVTPASQAALLRENEYISDAINSPRFVTRAKMTFVDLAGSERLLPDPKVDHKPTSGSAKSASKSLTSNLFGTKEVGVINPSLYVLGRVIAGLVRAHNSTQTSEVPYQDSVLTKLLIAPLARGNLLGANILIACIDDSPRCEYETLRTLKFATSCVQLRNSPDIATPKASKEDRAISELKMSIKKVKEDNQELRRTILATPSWGDKILAHCDEDTLETSAAFANAPPRLKPKIKDVKKPVSLSEKKRTWADWKLFETASAAKNKTKKTSFLPLPSHASSVMSGSRVYPVTGPVLSGSPTSLSRTSQMSHSLSQGSLQDTQSSNKASSLRGSSAPSPSKQHLHDASMEGEMDGSTAEAREEMRLMELGDGFKHSNDSNDPVYATGGQKIRPKSSPTEKTAFQMGAATMSAFPDLEEDQHDVSRRKLFSKTGPVPARHRATDYFEPVLDGKRGRGPEKTAKDQNHMAEVRMAAQLKKRVLDECKKKNHMPISPYLAHFVPKRVIKDRPTFEVPLLHDIVPLHASIHQDSPDSDDSHGHHERTAHAASHSGELRGHSQSGSPGASSSLVAKMNLSGTLHAHSPPRSRPHSRHTKRAQSGRRSSPGSAGRRSPQAGSQSPGKPRSPEIQKLQKLIRTPTMMFELLDAEYQNYPYDEEMYVNRKPLQERIVSSDKPRAAHGPPVITQMADTEEFSPDAALDLSVDGTSLSPAQKKDLKEEPQPDDEGEFDAYDEEFEAEENPVPVQEAPADETPTKVSRDAAASPSNAEFVPIASNKIEHPSGKTSPSISRASPTTIPSAPTSAGRAREVPLFPILGAANAPPAPRSPINLSMKMIAPKPSVPSPTQSQKLFFSQPTSRVESPAMTERNWEAEADLLMAPVFAANQERLEQENQIHFLDTFSPPRDSRTNTDSEPQESIAMMRGEVAGEEDYEEEFDEEEENVEKAPSDPAVEQVETKEVTTTAPVVELEPQPEAECTVEPAGNESEIAADEMAADGAEAVNNSETAPTEAPADDSAVPGEVEEVPVVAQAAEPAPAQEPDEEDYGEEFEEEEEAPTQKEEHDVTVEQYDRVVTEQATDAPVVEAEAASLEFPAEVSAEADTSSKTVEPVEFKSETDAPASDVAPAEDSNIVQNRTDEIEDVISAVLPAEPMATQDSAETVVPAEEPNEKLEEKATDNAATEPSEPAETVASPEQGEKEANYEEDYEMEFNEEEEEEQVSAAPVAAEEVVAPTGDTIVVPTEEPDCANVATEPELPEACEGAATTTEGEVAVETELQEKQTEVEGEVEQDTSPAEENANNGSDDQVADDRAETADADSVLLSSAFVAGSVIKSVSDCAVVDSVGAVAEPVEPVETAASEDNEPAASQKAAQVDNTAEHEEENYDEEFEVDDNEPEAVEKVLNPTETAEETLQAEPADDANDIVSNDAVVEQDVAEPSEQEPESAPEPAADLPAVEVVGTVDQEDADRTEAESSQTTEELATEAASPVAKTNQTSKPTPEESGPDSTKAAVVKPSVTYSPTKPKNFEAFSAKLSGDAVERAVSRLESASPKPDSSSGPLEIDLQDNDLTLSPMRRSAGETVLSQMSPLSPVRVLGDIDSHHFISAATFNTNTTTSEVFAHLQHEDVSELEELSAEYSPDAKLHGIAENDLTNASAASLLALSPPVEVSPCDDAAKDSEEVVASAEEQLQEEVTIEVTAENDRFPVGTRVEANYRSKGRWYAGVISRVRSAAGTVDIDYDDGEKETHVEQDLVRVEKARDIAPSLDSFKFDVVADGSAAVVDAQVDAVVSEDVDPAVLVDGSEPAVVPIVSVDAALDMPTEIAIVELMNVPAEDLSSTPIDAVSELKQDADDVHTVPEAIASVLTTLPVGTRVEANYRGKGRWYAGVISRVRSAAGTVDIDYDDGEKETHVEQKLIRLEKASVTPSAKELLETSEIAAFETAGGMEVPAAEIALSEKSSVPLEAVVKETLEDDVVEPTREVIEETVAAPVADVSGDVVFPVGTRVEGNYRASGHWYPGVVSVVHGDGSVDLDYDDDEKETGVAASLVRLEVVTAPVSGSALTVGARVEGNYRASGHWYPGCVSQVHGDSSVDIDYDDGEKETSVAVTLVRLEGSAVVESTSSDPVVDASMPAAVASVAAPAVSPSVAAALPVGYDDGEKETGVVTSLVRLEAPAGDVNAVDAEVEVVTSVPVLAASSLVANHPVVELLPVGARIEANYRSSGHWYPGCVAQVNADGTVDIDYDDGEKETLVALSLVRLVETAVHTPVVADEVSAAIETAVSAVSEPAPSIIEVGSRVEGNYRGKGEWLAGEVLRLHGGGMADVKYDHGEVEGFVPPAWLRLVASVEPDPAGTVEDAPRMVIEEGVSEVSAEAAKDSIEVSVSSALSNAPVNDSNASYTIDSEKHVAVEDAGLRAPAADNEAKVQETVAAVPSAEPIIEATELDLVEGTGEMSASSEGDLEKELASKSGEEPAAAAESTAPVPEFVVSGDVLNKVAPGEEGEGQVEGKSIPSFGDLLTEVPAASAEKPTEVNAPDDIEAGSEAQVHVAPLSLPEEDLVAVAATQEFESAAVEEVPASLEPGEVPAIEAKVALPVEVETEPVLHPDAVETVPEGDGEKVGTEETTSPEEVNTSADTADESEIAPVETVGLEKPLEESLTQEAAVNETKIPEASRPFVEQEAPPSVPEQVEQPEVVVEAMPEETPVPAAPKKVSAESATVEVSEEEPGGRPQEPTVEESASTAPSVPAAELEIQATIAESAEQSEEQIDVVTIHDSTEPAGLDNVPVETTAAAGSDVEIARASELSAKEIENTNLSMPPTEQETQPLLSEQVKAEPETPPSEPNGPEQPEQAAEPAAVSPVSVEDVPADNHTDNHPSDSTKLTPQASESMFDVDFSELASAKEPPINIANESAVDNKHGQSDQNGKDDEKDNNDKNDIAMDSATLAALALSAESTDEQDQDQEQGHDKQAPVANPHNDVGNKETDDAAQESVSAKPTISDKFGKSGKSGKSKKSAGGEEEEEDIYDVDF